MWKSRDEYVYQDDKGRWINKEFPPDSFTQYPNNSGYRNSNMEMLYYQFAVQYYDLCIEYQDREYHAFVDGSRAWITDVDTGWTSDFYSTANDLIKTFVFPDGKRLVDVVKNAKQTNIDIL